MKLSAIFPDWNSSESLRQDVLTDMIYNSIMLPKEALALPNVEITGFKILSGKEVAARIAELQISENCKTIGEVSLETIHHAKHAAYSVRHIDGMKIVAYKLWQM